MDYCKVLSWSFYKKILTNLKNVRKTRAQKRFIYGEKRKAWNIGERTQMPVTITEGLGATDKGQVFYYWGYTRESLTPPAF